MARIIREFTFGPPKIKQDINIPEGHDILNFIYDPKEDKIIMHALIDPDADKIPRTVFLVADEKEIPDDLNTYHTTFTLNAGHYHVMTKD